MFTLEKIRYLWRAEVNSVELNLLSKRVYPSIHAVIKMQSQDAAGSIKKEIKSPVETLTKGRCDVNPSISIMSQDLYYKALEQEVV